MIFYALDMAGAIISAEIGLSPSPRHQSDERTRHDRARIDSVLPGGDALVDLDLHHWMLAALSRLTLCCRWAGRICRSDCWQDIVARTSQTFVIALQLAAPIMAVSFIVSLVFSVLGRAVPQMNVWFTRVLPSAPWPG